MATFDTFRSEASAKIQAAGYASEIRRKSGETAGRYGSRPAFSTVGTESVIVVRRSRRATIDRTRMGDVRTDEPLMVFTRDADIQEDDRVVYGLDGRTYRILATTIYPTHVEARVQVSHEEA
jgi:hypothetical protein